MRCRPRLRTVIDQPAGRPLADGDVTAALPAGSPPHAGWREVTWERAPRGVRGLAAPERVCGWGLLARGGGLLGRCSWRGAAVVPVLPLACLGGPAGTGVRLPTARVLRAVTLLAGGFVGSV